LHSFPALRRTTPASYRTHRGATVPFPVYTESVDTGDPGSIPYHHHAQFTELIQYLWSYVVSHDCPFMQINSQVLYKFDSKGRFTIYQALYNPLCCVSL
jgi:hypothetical protein